MPKNTGIIYRNYDSRTNINDIKKIKYYCKKKKLSFFISNNFKLAVNLNLDGAYIPSFNRDFRHLSYKLNKNFLILGSAHNINEIKLKEKQKVEFIFISSLFKKNKNYLGIFKFKLLNKLTNKNVIALGGISSLNKRKLTLVDCFGFSGISYFE